MNPECFIIYVYSDGSKRYVWDTPYTLSEFGDTNSYWFKFYWDFVRSPHIRKGEYANPSDTYELEIQTYNIETGKIIYKWDTRKY